MFTLRASIILNEGKPEDVWVQVQTVIATMPDPHGILTEVCISDIRLPAKTMTHAKKIVEAIGNG